MTVDKQAGKCTSISPHFLCDFLMLSLSLSLSLYLFVCLVCLSISPFHTLKVFLVRLVNFKMKLAQLNANCAPFLHTLVKRERTARAMTVPLGGWDPLKRVASNVNRVKLVGLATSKAKHVNIALLVDTVK